MTNQPHSLPHPASSIRARMPLVIMLLFGIAACDRNPATDPAPNHEAATTPTNRIAIPHPVRRNLGIEFARVEVRSIESTLRVPGHFELLPNARRDHPAPLEGTVEILVSELDPVAPGTPLFRLAGPEWFELEDRIDKTITRLDSLNPIREASRRQKESLTERVSLWQERLNQLKRLQEAEGGNTTAVSQARVIVDEARNEIAELMKEDARLDADESMLKTELTSLLERRDRILGIGPCSQDDELGLLVCSAVEGVVEKIVATPGTHVAEGDAILSIIQPDRVRVRGRMLQSDLPLVSEGLSARISAPNAASDQTLPSMPATIRLSPIADPDGRTIDLLVTPERVEPWARPGVSVSLEVILEGGRLELAIPERAIVANGGVPMVFRRNPSDPDQAIRIDADLGRSDGRWIEILSGVGEGDQIVVAGQDQLLLATGGERPATGHFHADGTFHAEDH